MILKKYKATSGETVVNLKVSGSVNVEEGQKLAYEKLKYRYPETYPFFKIVYDGECETENADL